jgi:hypothetical protein
MDGPPSVVAYAPCGASIVPRRLINGQGGKAGGHYKAITVSPPLPPNAPEPTASSLLRRAIARWVSIPSEVSAPPIERREDGSLSGGVKARKMKWAGQTTGLP